MIKTHTASASNLTTQTSDNANTDLLNYCLADSEWLGEMFDKLKSLLVSVDDFALAFSADYSVSEMIETHVTVATTNASDMVTHLVNDETKHLQESVSNSVVAATEQNVTEPTVQMSQHELIVSSNEVNMQSAIQVTAGDIIDNKPLLTNELIISDS